MRDRRDLVLLIVGAAIAVFAGSMLRVPGYMDAEYYFATGLELSEGSGFQEPFVWNYLNDPVALPHPSHGYWMPLASLFAALPMVLLGGSFKAAQVPFVLLTALLPLLTSKFCRSVTRDAHSAFLAGLLAAVPGFFLPFFLTTDMFILYVWIGTAFFWSLHLAGREKSAVLWIVPGVSIGLAHLARADGLLFFIPLVYFILLDKEARLQRMTLAAAGYLFVMSPWFIRNIQVFGSPLPPGTQAALWMRSYEDLFRYPASELKPTYLLGAGWGQILLTRISALWTNLQRLLAENGLIFLAPLMYLGFRERWRQGIARAAALYLLTLVLVMSFIFPFAGAQGGMFHSTAALMPLLWMLSPFGLNKAVTWIGGRRGWNIAQAARNFGWIMIFIATMFTMGVFILRVFDPGGTGTRWDSAHAAYQEVGQAIRSLDEDPGVVMVNNPPGFYTATSLKSVVVPSGGIEALRKVSEQFQVDYLILDRNHPSGLRELYSLEQIPDWLSPVRDLDAGRAAPVLIFRLDDGQADP